MFVLHKHTHTHIYIYIPMQVFTQSEVLCFKIHAEADTLVEDAEQPVAEACGEQAKGPVQTGETGEQAKKAVQTAGSGEQAKETVQTEGSGEQAKEAVQTEGSGEQAKGAVQTEGPGEQVTEEPGVGVPKGAVQTSEQAKEAVQTEGPRIRSLDSMTTLSWGRRFSLDSLVPDTPMKQPAMYLEQQVLEIQGKLFQAFGDGATLASEDDQGRQVLGDLIMDWLIDLQACEYPPAQPETVGDAMMTAAMECLEA